VHDPTFSLIKSFIVVNNKRKAFKLVIIRNVTQQMVYATVYFFHFVEPVLAKQHCLLIKSFSNFLADVNLTKEKPSIKTATAFTQTVVKETCGIGVQTNSKAVCDASSQKSRAETREYGSQGVATSTANGHTQTNVQYTPDGKTSEPTAQDRSIETDAALNLQTAAIQRKHFY